MFVRVRHRIADWCGRGGTDCTCTAKLPHSHQPNSGLCAINHPSTSMLLSLFLFDTANMIGDEGAIVLSRVLPSSNLRTLKLNGNIFMSFLGVDLSRLCFFFFKSTELATRARLLLLKCSRKQSCATLACSVSNREPVVQSLISGLVRYLYHTCWCGYSGAGHSRFSS